jgi:hypothetical protein
MPAGPDHVHGRRPASLAGEACPAQAVGDVARFLVRDGGYQRGEQVADHEPERACAEVQQALQVIQRAAVYRVGDRQGQRGPADGREVIPCEHLERRGRRRGYREYGSQSLSGQLISAWASASSDVSNRLVLALTPARARVSIVWATCDSLNDSTPWALVWELTVTPLVASAARYSPW